MDRGLVSLVAQFPLPATSTICVSKNSCASPVHRASRHWSAACSRALKVRLGPWTTAASTSGSSWSGDVEKDPLRYSLTQRQGQRWKEGLRWSSPLPHIDWTRHHLQVLVVDSDHTARSRIAEGLFLRLAEWNGFGRCLLVESRGVAPGVSDGAGLELQYVATLLSEARRLKLDSHVMRQPVTSLGRTELDMYDLILAMDEEVQADVFGLLEGPSGTGATVSAEERAEEEAYYRRKVLALPQFMACCSDSRLQQRGGPALLPEELAAMLRGIAGGVSALRGEATSIQHVTMQAQPEEWQRMVCATLLSVAGLVAYLIDAYPHDLEEQWLE